MFNTLATWVEANCPAGAVQKNVLEAAHRAETEGYDYQVVIGAGLTKSATPYLVQTYGGNLFVFALTDEQARNCGVTGAMTSFCHDSKRPMTSAAPTLVIEGFEIDDADQRSWFEPLHGRCRYRSEATLPAYPCVRIEMILRLKKPPDQVCRVSLYCYPWIPPGEATIEFQLTPVCPKGPATAYVTPQLVAIFLSICTTPDQPHGQEAVPISDTLAALVTFR
jgi:hypothetical protein